jgi:hypothetical protein
MLVVVEEEEIFVLHQLNLLELADLVVEEMVV